MNTYSYMVYHFTQQGRLLGQHTGIVFANNTTQAKEKIWNKFGNENATLSDDDIRLIDPEEGFNMYIPH